MIWPLIAFGIGLIFFGAWGIDFAFLAAQNQQPVGLPFFPGRDIHVGSAFWWNLNFFAFMVPGNALVIVGSVL